MYGMKQWKEYKDEFIEASKKCGVHLVRFVIQLGQFVGMSAWMGFTWLANIRLKIPRTSLLIELVIFMIPAIFYYSRYVRERDRSWVNSYNISVKHEQDLILKECDGFKRGKKTVLDSLREATEKEEEMRKHKAFLLRMEQQAKKDEKKDSIL